MQRQVVGLTRQELYEKMWSQPAIALAEEFWNQRTRPGGELRPSSVLSRASKTTP
jgi:hypothetical protein